MDPFKRATTLAELQRDVAAFGKELQPCMLCGAKAAPHARNLTLIREDGARLVIVTRFCTRCHSRPDRARRTQAAVRRLVGVDVPLVFAQRAQTGRRN